MTPRRVVTALLVSWLVVPGCSASPSSEQELPGTAQEQLTQTLRQPFLQTSYICQSYRGYSHSSGYSFDIGVTPASCNAGNNDSGGKPVVAPAAGTVTKLPTTGINAYLCIQLDGGGAVSLGHVREIAGIAVGTKVKKGQQVAKVALASDSTSGNAGIAHLHFDAFDGVGCYNGKNKPFTGAFKMDCAPELPFNASYGFYNGTKLTPCASGSGGTGGSATGGTGGGTSGTGGGGTGGASCVQKVVSGAENEIFKDMPPGAFGKAEVEALFNAKITSGCNATKPLFCPECSLTRLQAVTMLIRAAQIDTSNPPATPTFSDVPKSDPGFSTVEAAAAAGITSGCGGGKFCPDAAINRGQLAALVVRTLGWPLVNPSAPSFSDVAIDHAFFEEIETVSDHCVSSGCGDGKFCPSSLAKRVTGAIFIARAFDLEGLNPCPAPSGAGGGAGAGGGSAGAAPGVGGATGSSGGFGGDGAADSGGSGPQSSPGDSDMEGGCGCVVGRRSANDPAALIGPAGFVFAFWRRRRGARPKRSGAGGRS